MPRTVGGYKRGGLGCGPYPCAPCSNRRDAGFSGIFSKLIDVAGSFVGDPQAGDQIAAQSPAAFGPITQNSQQIAATVLPDVAAQLKAQGDFLPSSTVGGQLQAPTPLAAFGGQYEPLVIVGGLGLAALLVLKAAR